MAHKIDIKIILDACLEPFVIVKKSGNLYEYEIGNDIDIFSVDAIRLTKEILHTFTNNSNGIVFNNVSIKITECERHSQIDFMEGNTLIVRLDIIDTLDIFKSILLEDNKYAQLAFRLFEYAEHPDKRKHLNFVKNEFIEK